jgi:hypothetical protein
MLPCPAHVNKGTNSFNLQLVFTFGDDYCCFLVYLGRFLYINKNEDELLILMKHEQCKRIN